jgi:hypothetical protein
MPAVSRVISIWNFMTGYCCWRERKPILDNASMVVATDAEAATRCAPLFVLDKGAFATNSCSWRALRNIVA